MAETNGSLQQTHHSNSSLQSLFQALDPISLILSQNSNSNKLESLKLVATDSFILERGPRYNSYAELRESRLRMKRLKEDGIEKHESKLTPPRKQVKFEKILENRRKGSCSVLAQSVPDFSAVLRKENRKPVNTLSPLLERTPPTTKNWSRSNGVGAKVGGSKSASAGEKKGGCASFVARKSYASIDELKGLSFAAANAINGENRGLRNGRGNCKTVLGYKQF